MDIDPENAAGQSELEGQTFFFCGTTCKAKFDAHPAQYPVKPAATA